MRFYYKFRLSTKIRKTVKNAIVTNDLVADSATLAF